MAKRIINGMYYDIPEDGSVHISTVDGRTLVAVNGNVYGMEGSGFTSKRYRKPEATEGDGFVLDMGESRELSDGTVLYRIKATRARLGGKVPSGAVGGWVPCATVLSDDAWIDQDSEVHSFDVSVRGSVLVQRSTLSGTALLFGDALLCDSTMSAGRVGDRAVVSESSITGDCDVIDDACVELSKLSGSGTVSGRAYLRDVRASGSVKVDGSARVSESTLSGGGKINGNAVVENVKLAGSAKISGNARVSGSALSGSAKISGDSVLEHTKVAGSASMTGGVLRRSSISGVVKVSGGVHVGVKVAGVDTLK